jgi:hypothetical protein
MNPARRPVGDVARRSSANRLSGQGRTAVNRALVSPPEVHT